jgi:Flp pilus assembly protein TadD
MSALRITVFAAVVTLLSLLAAPSSRAAAADNQICNVEADFALGREDYATAIVLHRKLIQSQPDNALAHYHLGFAYGMLGRRPEELSEYRSAARLGLKNWDLFLNLGLAYLEQHDLDQASKAFETAVSLGPEHAEAHFNLAIAYERENRFSKALSEITAARHLAPHDAEIANSNAILLVETGDLVDARNLWTHLAQVAPDYEPARINLSILNRSSPVDQTVHFNESLYSEEEIGVSNGQEDVR